MSAYIAIECPLCGKQSLFPVEEVAQDRLADDVAAHLVQQHPSTPATEAERNVERALEGQQVITTDNGPSEPRRWADHGL